MTETKYALITGAGRGIGAATAKLLAKNGFHAIITARSEDQLSSVVDEIKVAGGTATAISADLSDRTSVKSLIDEVHAITPKLDVLVNNAGYCDPMTMLEMPIEAFDRHFEINVTAVYSLCHVFAGAMVEKKQGVIVNVASIAGVNGVEKFPGFTAYAAAKAAVIVFTEALAAELKPHNVRANCVSPGSVDTKMLRDVAPGIAPDMTPEEIAGTIAFLCSDQARPMNGRNIEVFG